MVVLQGEMLCPDKGIAVRSCRSKPTAWRPVVAGGEPEVVPRDHEPEAGGDGHRLRRVRGLELDIKQATDFCQDAIELETSIYVSRPRNGPLSSRGREN